MENTATRICIPARSQCLERIRAFSQEVLQTCTSDPKLRWRLVLAIDEAVANVVEHAYGKSGEFQTPTIDLSIEAQKDRIVIEILDRGIPFDPRRHEDRKEPPSMQNGEACAASQRSIEAPAPPGAADLPERPHRRGFGLQIIRDVMDEIEYRRTPSGENVLVLIKRLSQ